MQSKNTCEGVHLIVKLPAISLQASKFTKNELLHTFFMDFSQILSYCFFLFIVSWKGASQWEGFAFQLGGASFLSEGAAP